MGKRSEAVSKTQNAMLSGGIVKPVLLFALPVMLGNFFQQLYITVDAVIVGRFLGSHALAAVSVASPILFIVVYFLFGACTGFSVLISQLYGAGDFPALKREMATGFLAGSAFTLALSAFCLASAKSLLVWTKAPPEVCIETMNYLQIVFAGLIFSFLYNFYASALRGVGNSKAAFLIQISASVLHVVMNLVFVGSLRLGVRGSALATVLSQLMASGLSVLYIRRYELSLRVSLCDLRIDAALLKKTLGYSWAAALQSTIVFIGRFLTQSCVNPLGAEAIAGYNAATRVENLVSMPLSGMSAAYATFGAQNAGAKRWGRVLDGAKASAAMNLAYAVVACFVMYVYVCPIMGVFVSGTETSHVMVQTGATYLRLMAFYLLLAAVDEIGQSFFRSVGAFYVTMLLSLAQIIVRVAFSFGMTSRMGVGAIAHATGLGWTLVALALIPLIRRFMKNLNVAFKN